MARSDQPGGTGSLAQAVVGAHGGPAGGSTSQRPGHTRLGGRGVLPRRWWVLKEGLRGVAVSNGLGTPAPGDGDSAQAVVGSQRGHVGGSSSQRRGHTSLGGRGIRPGGGRCSRRACGGQQLPTARAHQPRGTGGPAQPMVGAQGATAGAAIPNGPGTPAWGDGESCPGGGWCSRRAYGGNSPQRAGLTSLGRQRVLPKRRPVPGGCRQGAVAFSGACPLAGGVKRPCPAGGSC